MTRPLDDPRALPIAQALLAGFNRHYRLFRATSAAAKQRFEQAAWKDQQRAQRERIEFYAQRVAEAVKHLETEFKADSLPSEVWEQVKLHYIGLLVEHMQPELAETFFNSVTTRILDRQYFRNRFLFVRPAVSTEYIENAESIDQPTYRAYYPSLTTLRDTVRTIVEHASFNVPFDDLERDVDDVHAELMRHNAGVRLRTNFQLQVLSSPFYRNKGAYIVGKVVNGYYEQGFALPILHLEREGEPGPGRLVIDTLLYGQDDLQMLFSFARAYFMVEMPIPAAYVQFLRSVMPGRPRSEIYNALGLQKQGKNLFYRDFLYHLRHSSDSFRIAPGIKGMVMLVFDLPSFPFVFKMIKDFYPPQKETTRELIEGKYQLVKQHDRVGRMADSLEFSDVPFPRARFDADLLAEIRHYCPSLIAEDGDALVISHLYIERRMVPLNVYLQDATPAQLESAVIEYGNAIKDLIAANIFPGDMLWKNFGVTRQGKVVFYDYDEIEYITDSNFRKVPAARDEDDEMSGEIWYKVGPKDVFPETFGPFLLGNPQVREVFMKFHADLLDPTYWQHHKERIRAGHVHDVFPYEPERRFAVRRKQGASQAEVG